MHYQKISFNIAKNLPFAKMWWGRGRGSLNMYYTDNNHWCRNSETNRRFLKIRFSSFKYSLFNWFQDNLSPYQKPSQFLISIADDEKRWVTRAHLRLIQPPWWEELNLSSTGSSPSVTLFHHRTSSTIPTAASRSITVTPMLLNPRDDHAGEESDDELRKEDITFSVAADTGPLTPGTQISLVTFSYCNCFKSRTFLVVTI